MSMHTTRFSPTMNFNVECRVATGWRHVLSQDGSGSEIDGAKWDMWTRPLTFLAVGSTIFIHVASSCLVAHITFHRLTLLICLASCLV